MLPDETPLTARQMCARYQIGRATLSQWIKQGMPHYRNPTKGNRSHLRFYVSEVDDWRRVEMQEPAA